MAQNERVDFDWPSAEYWRLADENGRLRKVQRVEEADVVVIHHEVGRADLLLADGHVKSGGK